MMSDITGLITLDRILEAIERAEYYGLEEAALADSDVAIVDAFLNGVAS